MSKDLTHNLNGSLEDKVDRLIIAVESLASRIGSMESQIESMDSRLGNVERRLEALETKVDERMKDTRPMLEAVQAQLTEVESAVRSEIRSEVQLLRAEVEKGFRIMERRLEHYSGEVTKVYAYERELEDRVEKIEKGLNH